MKCQTDFLLTVNPAGLDWNLMVWDLVNFVSAVDGTATGSFSGDHGNGHIVGSHIGPGIPARVEVHGSLTYTGPQINCKVTLTSAYPSPAGASFGLHVLQDGVEIAVVGDTGSPQPASGVYNFTIIAGVGSVIEVEGNVPAIAKYMAVALTPSNITPAEVIFSFALANV
jgi:hypothetical protein